MDLECQHLEEKVGGLQVQGQLRSYENFSEKKDPQIHYLKNKKQIKECSILQHTVFLQPVQKYMDGWIDRWYTERQNKDSFKCQIR